MECPVDGDELKFSFTVEVKGREYPILWCSKCLVLYVQMGYRVLSLVPGTREEAEEAAYWSYIERAA